MENEDIRWKQRFQNFEKALDNLSAALAIEQPSEVERAGIIQFFEFTFELGWKTLKDYLQEQGESAKFPREVIKEAFRHQMIHEGEVWMDMLAKRNLMAHTYDEAKATLAYTLIRDVYHGAIRQTYNLLKAKHDAR